MKKMSSGRQMSAVLVMLMVGIVNGLYEVGLVNSPYEVGLVNSPYEVGLVNSPYEVGLVNGPYEVGIVNGPCEVGIVNSLCAFGLVNGLYAATLHANSGVNRQLSAAGYTAIGVTRPNYEWRFVDSLGTDYDTVGGATQPYRNYGSSTLTTGLTNGNAPSLTEGILQPNMGGVRHNGTTNFEYINDGAVLSPGANDFGAFAWVRYTSATASQLIFAKDDGVSILREWLLRTSPAADGGINVLLSDDGTADAGHLKDYRTVSVYNDGKWHQVGFTWISDVLVVYVDGAVATVTKTTDDPITTIYSGIATPTIGVRNAGGGFSNYFTGDIAWAAYWQGAGTPTGANVLALYNAQAPLGTLASPYPTLQSAVYAGAAGDTILMAGGRYQETVTVATAFDYIGATTSTFGSLPELYGAALPAAAGVVGMTVSAKNEIGFLTFRGYSTTSTGIGLLADASSDGSLFHHLEVDSCRNGVDFDGSATADSLINSVIDGGSLTNANGWRATTSTAVSVYLYNNIIVNCKTGLTKAAAQTLVETNNCFFGNTSADYAGSLNASDLLVNPRFRGGNDYRPQPLSNVLNCGLDIHVGTAPFVYLQGAPEIGVWEVIKSQNTTTKPDIFGRSGPWARSGGEK